jgi:aquaporin Z
VFHHFDTKLAREKPSPANPWQSLTGARSTSASLSRVERDHGSISSPVGIIDSQSLNMPPAATRPVTALAPSASLAEAIHTHWREYLMEGTELGSLMLSTCIFGTLLYSSDSPLNYLALSRGVRSVLMGTAIAMTTFLIIRSPFGRRSGAHFNPAVTLAFLWLRRIHRWDAVCYVLAHFVGAVVGVAVAHEILGVRLSSAPVRYLVTLPGTYGRPIAFIAEFVLSGLLMGIVLYASNHRLLARFTPILVALLTIFYFALSSSISGFSVNPARTFSSAMFAWIWEGIWIYFSAPCLGMLMSAAIYVDRMGWNRVYCAKVFHDRQSPCPFRCHFDRLFRET